MLFIASTILLSLIAVAIDSQARTPHYLLIVRERLRPGVEEAYSKNEAALAAACLRLKCPHPYLALASLVAPKEVWWLNAFASQEEKDEVERAYARNVPLMTELTSLGKHKEAFRDEPITTLARYRPDLSGAVFDLKGARFFVVTATRDGRKVDGAVFAAPDGEYFVFTRAGNRVAAQRTAERAGSESRVVAVEPHWSFPDKAWVDADPTFWRLGPRAPGR